MLRFSRSIGLIRDTAQQDERNGIDSNGVAAVNGNGTSSDASPEPQTANEVVESDVEVSVN